MKSTVVPLKFLKICDIILLHNDKLDLDEKWLVIGKKQSLKNNCKYDYFLLNIELKKGRWFSQTHLEEHYVSTVLK